MTDMSRAVPVRPASPGPQFHGELSNRLLVAASRGQLEVVKDLLAAGAGIETDRDGRNALHFAAQEGHADVCKYLVAQGCDIDMQDVMGYSPLLRAASQGAQEAAQVLLDSGCDVNIQDEHGNAAIHEACWNGFSKTAELLVKYNCDVSLVNKAGFTALHLAAQNGHNESSRVLLYAGCNPDLKNNYGDTALHTAARYGHAGVARILISAKCRLSEQNKNGDSALHIAAALKRRKIAKILVESGIDVDLFNKQNERAIDVARRKEHPEIMLIISTYSKPKPSSFRGRQGEHFGVTFKDEIDIEDGPVVCPEDEPPLKPDPKSDKQEKERRFFFFKKKKKDKEKEKTPTTPTTARKKPELFHPNQTKPAVHGFFSQYVPRDGVQFYRDLAGNIKQGPIGYAPVCQCGPSLKRLETSITDTRDSLYNHIDASHHVLSQRIENLDIRTRQQAQATEAMLQDRFNEDGDACHARISERLKEERRETRAFVDQFNADMRDELEGWLSDKLASYGHCLDHHHDDSALPPRNLFLDFPTMGRLVRSRSDETLSASDCSGKFRKKDFYASRQAAMQQIRGWDVPAADKFSNKERTKRREKNNNIIPSNNQVVTHAQVHTKGSDRLRDNGQQHISSNEPDILSPSTNSTSSPGTLGNSQTAGIISNMAGGTSTSFGHSSIGRRGPVPYRPPNNEIPHRDVGYQRGAPQGNAGVHSRVTFSSDQQWQQPQYQQQQQLRQHSGQRVSSPQPQQTPHRSGPDSANPNRQSIKYTARIVSPGRQYNAQQWQQSSPAPNYPQAVQQNLAVGGPPDADAKSGEKGGSQISPLTGQELSYSGGSATAGDVPQRLTRYQDGYGVHYVHPRTLSTDSLLKEDNPSSYSQHISRCRSVENTIDDRDQRISDIYNSGYVTDSALRPSSIGSSSRFNANNRSVRDTHSASPALRTTTRYRLPETSTGASSGPTYPQSHVGSPYTPPQHDVQLSSSGQSRSGAQSPDYVNKAWNRTGGPPASRVHDVTRDFILSKQQHKSMHGLSDNSNASMPLSGFNMFGKGDSVRNSIDRSAVGCKSDSNLVASQSQQVQFRPPIKECLQHETTNAVSTPDFVTGNKEDSTCSSNQDSGYSSRNHGGGTRKGGDTSGGTPSSSFSMERSGCNTPSNAGSPFTTQGDFPNSEVRTQQPTGYGNQYSSPGYVHAHRPDLGDGARTSSPQWGTSFDGHTTQSHSVPLRNEIRGNSASKYVDASQSSIPLRSKSPHYPQSPPTHPILPKNYSQPNSGGANKSYYNENPSFHTSANSGFVGQVQNERTPRENSVSERQIYSQIENNSMSYNVPELMQQNAYEYTRASTPGPASHISQAQREQSNRPQPQTPTAIPRHMQTPAGTINNSSSVNSRHSQAYDNQSHEHSSVPQTAVQAHIEGWYQRKLMEAAQRLRQNQNYNQPLSEGRTLYSSKDDLTLSPQGNSGTQDNTGGGYSYNDHQSSSNCAHNQYQSNYPVAQNMSNVPYNSRPQSLSVSSTYHQHQPNMEGSYHSPYIPNPRERFEQRGNNYNSQRETSQNRNVNPVKGPRSTFYDRNSNINGGQPTQGYSGTQSLSIQNNNMSAQSMPATPRSGLHYDPVRGSDV